MARFKAMVLVVLLGLAAMQAAWPQVGLQGQVKLTLGSEGDLWAGQQVTVNLDLMTTGFSFSNTHFNLPEVEGAFLLQTDTTTIKLTETIGGVAWQIVRYPLALYPQKPGMLRVPPIEVRFGSALGFGSEARDFRLQTEALRLEVNWPPGANTDSLVVTTGDFQLHNEWQHGAAPYKPGDALTLLVRRTAADTSGMLLPPLPVYRVEGLAAYPDAPVVNDHTQRGTLRGEREDRITWVVEQAGQYTIPGIRFQWWDPLQAELKDRVVPGIEIEVIEGPAGSTTGVEATNGMRGHWPWLTIAGTVLALLVLAAVFKPAWRLLLKTPEMLRKLAPKRALLPHINPRG